MAKLAEGNRVYDAVANVAVLASELNDLQDQLKAMLGPQTTNIAGMTPPATGWTWDASTTNQGKWDVVTDDPQIWVLPHRTGQLITAISMDASRSGAVNAGGSFSIYKQELGVARVNIAYADLPWNIGADGVETNIAVDKDGVGGAFASFAIEAGFRYYIYVAGIAARTHVIRNMWITAQFGN